MKSLLILTASFGEGHNAAARNLRDAFSAVSPETKVVVSDPFLEAYGAFNRLCAKAYLGIINHLPGVWQKAFEVLDNTQLVEQHMGLYGAAANLLERLLDEHRPDTVVSVYPGCNHLLDYVARRRVRRPYRTVTIITDSLTINSVWHRAHSDLFLVANEATADIVREAGVPAEKVRAPGFPVPPVFATLGDRHKAPPADGIWKVLYVVNSGRHLAPDIVRELLAIENVKLTVTVGRDDDLRRRIETVSNGAPPEIHGWTPELPRLMAENHILISKAGGATVQETLAACTPMIITQVVPGQEEGNARLILESGAGALATTPATIAAAVREPIADGGRIWSAWHQAATLLSRPGASEDIARFLRDGPPQERLPIGSKSSNPTFWLADAGSSRNLLHPMKAVSLRHIASLAAAVILAQANSALADLTWTGGIGSWGTASKWAGTANGRYHVRGGTAVVGDGVTGTYSFLYVGSGGSGTVEITGGDLSGGAAQIGYNAPGTVTVASVWTATNDIYIGGNSSGSLSIEGGLVNSGSNIRMGYGAGSTGSLTINGGSLNNAGTITVGWTQNSFLTLHSGNISTTSSEIASSGTGVATVNDGTWENSDVLRINQRGTLTINGGYVSAEQSWVDNSRGSLTVIDGTLYITGTNTGLQVGLTGTGSIHLNGGYISTGRTVLASAIGSSGTATISSGTWNNLSEFAVNNKGILTIGSNGTLETARLTVAASGTVNLAGGKLRITQSGSFSSAKINLTGSSTLDSQEHDVIFSGSLTGTGGIEKTGTGALTLSGSNSYQGETHVTEGTLRVVGDNSSVTGETFVSDEAAFAGTGTWAGAVTVTGTLAPEPFSGGQLTLEGALTLQAGASLLLQFDGTASGQFSQLDVQGLFTGGGTLVLWIDEDFLPSAGDEFLIFNGTTPGFDEGSFAIVSNLGSGLAWDTSLLQSQGVISIIPEPGSSTLILLSAAAAWLARRRKRSSKTCGIGAR